MAKTRTKTRRVKGSASRGRSRRWKWVLIVLLVLLLIPAMQVAVVRFRVNRFAPRGFGLASNHVSGRFYVVKSFASRGLTVLGCERVLRLHIAL